VLRFASLVNLIFPEINRILKAFGDKVQWRVIHFGLYLGQRLGDKRAALQRLPDVTNG
jgi:hypothetical protein